MKKLLALSLLPVSSLAIANSEIEKVFWDCDYTASTSEMSISDGATCGIVYETILQEKFKGSFKDLMAWWKENKDREHKLRKENDSKVL